MPMNQTTASDGQVHELMEEFISEVKQGKNPKIEDYCRAHPDLAEKIRDVFEAALMVEELKPSSQDSDASAVASLPGPAEQLDQVGDYRIIREVGRGGMGVVYEAEQLTLSRRVALKVLQSRMAEEPRAALRFQREARAAARMHHTNIVPVFDVGQEGEHLFYTMQLIQGQGLEQVIEDLKTMRQLSGTQAVTPGPDSPSIAESLVVGRFQRVVPSQDVDANGRSDLRSDGLSETISQRVDATVPAALPGSSEVSTAESNRPAYYDSVARIGLQVADALSYAHARGIIHRDIKPSNLLLDANGVVWVTDFGLAKTDDQSMTHTGDILGTVRYMSPERFRGHCDVRSDIYSLGLTMYELLTLQPAFRTTDQVKLIEQVRTTDPSAPRRSDPEIPRDLETIVLKAIDKEPKSRYQSADELVDDLRRFIDDEPIKARRLSPAERFVRWSRRNRAVAASLVTTAVLLVMVAGMATLAAVNSEKHSRELESQLRIITAMRLAAESLSKYNLFPIQSMLVALEAVNTTRQHDGTVVPAAREALMNTTALLGGQPLVRHGAGINSVSLGPHGDRLVTGGRDGIARVWKFSDPTQPPRELKFHEGPINAVMISPDGHWIVTGSSDHTVAIWSSETFEVSHVLRGHTGAVTSLSISRDGRWLASASHDSTVRIWDLSAEDPGAAPKELVGHEVKQYGGRQVSLMDVQFSHNDRMLFAGGFGATAHVWDNWSSEPRIGLALPRADRLSHRHRPKSGTAHRSAVSSAAFSPDGRWLVTGCHDDDVRVWDLHADDPTVSCALLRGHDGRIRSLAISPDGRWLVSGSEDLTARVWDMQQLDAPPLVLRGHERTINSVCISHDGHWLITSSSDGTARRWDLRSLVTAPNAEVRAIAVTPDSRWLITGHRDGQVRVRDLKSSEPDSSARILYAHEYEVSAAAISPDGRWLVTGGLDKVARLFDLRADSDNSEPRVLAGHEEGIHSVAIGPNNRWLATGSEDGTARLWDLESAALTSHVLPGHVSTAWEDRSLAFSPDGRWLATGSIEDVVELWDVRSGVPESPSFRLRGNGRLIFSMAISANSHWLVTSSKEGAVRLWDLSADDPSLTGQDLLGADTPVGSVDIGPNSRWLVAGCGDGTAQLWDLTAQDPTSRSHKLVGHRISIFSTAFSPDGRWLATGSADDTARLWNLHDLNSPPVVLRGHDDDIDEIAFSPDSRWLITGSNPGRIWDLNLDTLIARAMRLADRSLTAEERRQFFVGR